MDSRWSPMKFFRSAFHNRHETKISSWLPPVESWDSGGTVLPYGWETAIDKEGKMYYINHTNRTTTSESPSRRGCGEDEIPAPREVQLTRDPQAGFGFVAGSEKPVIVRFVTEGGPNENKLMPGDQIMKINGEDVMLSPREHVIELIRSCKQTVTLLVCQPLTNNTTRKSALLTAAKKAKLKNNPSRVRFSEGVIINGSPLYSPSPVDGPFLPNVLKVFLENGQTKSFKYDSTTTVQDVLNSLFEKLSIKGIHHFCLATEHVKITRRNRLTILDPKDTLAKIAAKPGAHHLRCVFRVTFVPRDAYDLLQRDPTAFEYLYMQCCNDVVEERFTPELKYDTALRLTALNMRQHCLSNGMQGKVTVKAVERECGLDRFVPVSLLETMKLKELRKLLSHFLKQNQSLCAPGHKHMTPLQAKLHYLKIISELPSYGSKCFNTNISDRNPEMTLLVSPRFGISQISCLRSSTPVTLARLEEVASVTVKREDEWSSLMELSMKDTGRQPLTFSLEEKDADEFALLLVGYYRLLVGKELHVRLDKHSTSQQEAVPTFHCRHTVREAPWSYPPPPTKSGVRSLDLAVLPPSYAPCELQSNSPRHKSRRSSIPSPTPVDHNMNETPSGPDRRRHRTMIDERHPGIDYRTVISMELLEDSSGDVDVDIYEAKNDEVIRRISEMNEIVTDAESYLSDGLKVADSLVLLAQSECHPERSDESPSESDTDPNESPLHRSVPIRNSINAAHPMIRRDSSFGLHSPDLLPNINSGNNILDILKHMQAEEALEEGTVCFDPEIIDLTFIPPPITPEAETTMDPTIESPPAAFHGELFRRLENCNSVEVINGGDPIDSALPPPPVEPLSNEDLSAYIIPPPPSSSPSTAAQNEIIARFMAAAEDINSLFQSSTSEVALHELHQLGSEFRLLEQQSCFPLDSDSHSGDSSGYDTLTSSLTSYSDTLTSDDMDILWNVTPSSTPVLERSPSEVTPLSKAGLNGLPVPPCVKTSCVDDVTSPLSITSPSSTTSSDSSVILESSWFRLPSEVVENASQTGSCDDLLSRRHDPAPQGIVRSVSWSDLDSKGERMEEELQLAFHTSASLRQNRLRRSFNRGPMRGNVLSRSFKYPEGLCKTTTENSSIIKYPPPTECTTNGTIKPLLHPNHSCDSKTNCVNGQVNGLRHYADVSSAPSSPFQQAQRDISAMVSHLQKVTPSRVSIATEDREKLTAAKDALINESRQFVTSSKVFVKSAMESSEKMIENMAVCVALLNRMTAIGELIVLRSPPSEPVAHLVEKLKEVAFAYFHTVEAAQQVIGARMDQPQMSTLMQRATTLATSLTSLMRTLRAMF